MQNIICNQAYYMEHCQLLHYFNSPSYLQMTLTGLMVMMFSKTNNRKSCLVKCCGCMCLLSALLCVVVTVTTTVVHMNRYTIIIVT